MQDVIEKHVIVVYTTVKIKAMLFMNMNVSGKSGNAPPPRYRAGQLILFSAFALILKR